MFSAVSTSAVDTVPVQITDDNVSKSNANLNASRQTQVSNQSTTSAKGTRKIPAVKSDSLVNVVKQSGSNRSLTVTSSGKLNNNPKAFSIAAAAIAIKSSPKIQTFSIRTPKSGTRKVSNESKVRSANSSATGSQIGKKSPNQTMAISDTKPPVKITPPEIGLNPNCNSNANSVVDHSFETHRLALILLDAMTLGLFASVILYRFGCYHQIDERVHYGKAHRIIGLHVNHFVLYMLILQAVNFVYGWTVMVFDFASQILYFAILIVLIDIGNIIALSFQQYLYFHIFLFVYAALVLLLWFLVRKKNRTPTLPINNNNNGSNKNIKDNKQQVTINGTKTPN